MNTAPPPQPSASFSSSIHTPADSALPQQQLQQSMSQVPNNPSAPGSPDAPMVIARKNDPLANPFGTSNVYINGLPPLFTDDELLKLTTGFDHVVSVKMFKRHLSDRPSAYGFVLFDDIPEAQRFIIYLCNYSEYHPSFAKTQKYPGVPQQDLNPASQPYIPLHSKHSGSNVARPSDLLLPQCTAARAQQHLNVGFDHLTFAQKMDVLKDEQTTNLYLHGLPMNITPKSFQALFYPYVIRSSRCFETQAVPPKLVAFVRLESRYAAEETIDKLNGSQLGANGEKLIVRFADNADQRSLRREERIARGHAQALAKLVGRSGPTASHTISTAPTRQLVDFDFSGSDAMARVLRSLHSQASSKQPQLNPMQYGLLAHPTVTSDTPYTAPMFTSLPPPQPAASGVTLPSPDLLRLYQNNIHHQAVRLPLVAATRNGPQPLQQPVQAQLHQLHQLNQIQYQPIQQFSHQLPLHQLYNQQHINPMPSSLDPSPLPLQTEAAPTYLSPALNTSDIGTSGSNWAPLHVSERDKTPEPFDYQHLAAHKVAEAIKQHESKRRRGLHQRVSRNGPVNTRGALPQYPIGPHVPSSITIRLPVSGPTYASAPQVHDDRDEEDRIVDEWEGSASMRTVRFGSPSATSAAPRESQKADVPDWSRSCPLKSSPSLEIASSASPSSIHGFQVVIPPQTPAFSSPSISSTDSLTPTTLSPVTPFFPQHQFDEPATQVDGGEGHLGSTDRAMVDRSQAASSSDCFKPGQGLGVHLQKGDSLPGLTSVFESFRMHDDDDNHSVVTA